VVTIISLSHRTANGGSVWERQQTFHVTFQLNNRVNTRRSTGMSCLFVCADVKDVELFVAYSYSA
jgi:hypothetical protein